MTMGFIDWNFEDLDLFKMIKKYERVEREKKNYFHLCGSLKERSITLKKTGLRPGTVRSPAHPSH